MLMHNEGRKTVDNLNAGLSDIDTKASKLMRANIVLTGLLLSGFSFASNSDSIDTSPFVNSFSIGGIEINRRANVKNAFYIGITILLVLASVILLSASVFVGAFDNSFTSGLPGIVWLVALSSIVAIGRMSDIKGDYEQWKQYRRPD